MCDLFTTTIYYLKQVVSPDCLRQEQVKLDKIRQWPRPRTDSEMALNLGLCKFYQNLMPALAHVSDALYKAARILHIE